MRFVLPTPKHGWRDFAGEVGIIVLGVLLALAAEQVAVAIRDRDDAIETRREIAAELNDDLASIDLRRLAEPCIDRRLAELRAILGDWSRTGRFDTPSWVAQSPKIEVTLTRFEAATTAGRFAHLTGKEQYRIGAIVEGIRRFDQNQTDERVIWGRLRALQAGPEALSPTDRTMLLTALQDASLLDYEIRIDAQQILPLAKDYGFQPNFAHFRATAGRTWVGGRFKPSICTPIDTPRDEANRTQVTPLPL